MYALVKWCAGDDKGKFSIVHIKYIRNFDLESFLNGVITYEDEFAVEWGVGKRPKGGFPIYMATVQSVGDINTLERKLDKRTKKDSEDDAIVGKRKRVAKRLWEDEDEDEDDPPTAVATVSGTKAASAIHNQGSEILASISLKEQEENSDNELSLVRQELLEIKKFIFTEIPQIKEMLNRSSMHLGSQGSLPSPSNPVQIEEIVPGSGVYVSRNVWRSACQASSGTSMARILLLGVFDIETLIKSNLRGGESKVSKVGDGERRSGLDEIKVKAIMDAVMSKHSVSAGQIGTALNGKMAELRLAMSRKNVN
ncbi:uncharacterized protein LOC120459729 [Pimephales promelas]|uniref:uncharacterized protein LOC120459729 n=1 Tax=Pimephales promelas TaxID=90988 RepID=UPI001955569C|nr:uncharacterized protein LOC120459729 [Pimephales promelas]